MSQPTTLSVIQATRQYLDYVERHILNVQKAWDLIQEKCKGKGFKFLYDDCYWYAINADVKHHDRSKLSAAEFTQYRQWFFPVEGEQKDYELFNAAWEHHKANNDHHWQNWTQKKSYDDEVFVVMMVIDWVAMGFEFGDTAQEYYEKNKDKIDLPEWAVKFMYEIFECIYPDLNKAK